MICFYEDCENKNIEKVYICDKCNDITYCSKLCQKLDWKDHKVSCIEQFKSAYELKKLVYKDDFQYLTDRVSIDYGFINCNNMEEKVNLLGLYQGLIKFQECNINKVHEYYLQNKLPELIVQEFFYKSSPKNCGNYFKWFINNMEIVRRKK